MKFILTLLLALPFSAHALFKLDVKIDDHPLSFLIDPHKIVQIEGLPYLGLHLYSIQADTLYIQHPEENGWHSLPLGNLENILPTAYLEKGQESGDFHGTNNRHWALRVGSRICDHAFTNQDAAKKTGLNISHLAKISAGLNSVYGSPHNTNGCQSYLVSPAVGGLVGLPIHTSGAGGKMDVMRLSVIKGQKIPHPETTTLLNTPARIRFLTRQLSQEQYNTFIKTSQKLPDGQKLRALQHLLSQN